MFCSNCGKEIEDSSRFCRYCGAEQPKEIELKEEISSPPPKEETKNSVADSCLFQILFLLGLVCLCLLSGLFASKVMSTESCTGNTSTQQPFSRDATNSDVSIDSNESLTSLSIIIRPYHDINNLRIKVEFLDSKGNIVYTETKNIGNVKEGQEYTTYISVLDLPSSISKYRTSVVAGTVSYFS